MAKKINLPALIRDNQSRWDSAKFSPRKLQIAAGVAKRLCAPKAKAIYRELEAVTSVPWYAIAVIHEREASQRWDRSIAQGDRWDRKSVNVPRGRGPFPDFKAAAIDALANCAPYASKWKDWSEGGALTLLELYNGTGYELYHNMASPYLWAGTQHYVRGKYTSDGHFDGNAVDQQLGVAILIKQMMAIDSEVTFGQPAHGPDEILAGPETGKAFDPADHGINPDDYPEPEGGAIAVDPNTPPPSTYVDGPPAANVPIAGDASDMDKLQKGGLNLVKSAIGEKVGTKTAAATATAASTAVAAADDSWFNWILNLLHSPRFWIIAAIVTAFIAFLIYNCVQNYKAKKGIP